MGGLPRRRRSDATVSKPPPAREGCPAGRVRTLDDMDDGERRALELLYGARISQRPH